MGSARKRKSGDSTIIVSKAESRDRISATQILRAEDIRAGGRQGRRAGESSVILREGEKIRRAGLGVSVKFALEISAAIGVFMALFGLVLYNNVKGALNDEIDAAGVQAARALAIPEFITWNTFFRAYAGTAYAHLEDELARGERTIPSGALNEAQLAAAERAIDFNKTRLGRLLSGNERILDAMITSPDRTRIIRIASGRPQLDFAGTSRPEAGGVTIEYGTYTLRSGETLAARAFTAPIKDAAGITEGMATVVLSEEKIQEKLAAVRAQVLSLALIFVLLGVGVAFVMGNRITSPITSLTQDVEIIAKGDLDHHPRVHSSDEIGVLARTIDRMSKSLKHAQQAEVDHAKQKHQLQIALEIQSNLFPKSLPALPGFEMEAHYRAGPEVGGDYYDVFRLADGRTVLMVSSASGRGIPAAMLTTMSRSFTTAIAERETSIAALYKAVNRLLSPDLRRGMYVTALACVLEPEGGKLTVVNAGHNPLVLFDGSTNTVRPIHSDGIALGFDKGPVFDRSLQTTELALKPGDRIVLCTPGLFGVKNHEGKELGEENFYRLVAREGAKNSTAFVNLVAHTLEKFAERGHLDSDITFLTLKRTS